MDVCWCELQFERSPYSIKTIGGKGTCICGPPSPFRLLSVRANSFSFQPLKFALDLAEAGFVWTGINDQAICFHCKLRLEDWYPYDNPFLEHVIFAPDCEYITLRTLGRFNRDADRERNRRVVEHPWLQEYQQQNRYCIHFMPEKWDIISVSPYVRRKPNLHHGKGDRQGPGPTTLQP